jgi:hypothetical protein
MFMGLEIRRVRATATAAGEPYAVVDYSVDGGPVRQEELSVEQVEELALDCVRALGLLPAGRGSGV